MSSSFSQCKNSTVPPSPPSSSPEFKSYRPCVGIMLLNRNGLVWVGQREDTPQLNPPAEGPGSWWQMPQGGIDEYEDPQKAALRELFEETSVKTVEILGETKNWLLYDLPSELQGKAWGGRFRGQRQKWFAARFHGKEDEINISPEPPHKREFIKWQWVPVNNLVSLIVPFKRDVYRLVVNEFGHLAKPLDIRS